MEDPYVLDTRCELIVLRQLLECVIRQLPPTTAEAAATMFAGACLQSMGTMLAEAQGEEAIDAMDRAQVKQIDRLRRLCGLRVQPPPEG